MTEHDGENSMAEKVIPLPTRHDPDMQHQVKEAIRAENEKYGESGGGGEEDIDSRFVRDCLEAMTLGDGELYKAMHRGKFLFNKNLDCWLVWAGHHWDFDIMTEAAAAVERVAERYLAEIVAVNKEIRELEDGDSKEKALKTLRKDLKKRVDWLRKPGNREQVLTMAHTSDNPLAITGDEIDKNPWLLACPNCVIDLKTGMIRDGRPDDYLLRFCPTPWEGWNADRAPWANFLNEIFEEDFLLTAYIQRLFGTAIVGYQYEHIFPMLIGPGGRNGKGTIVETISYVLGSLCVPIPSEMLLSTYRPNPAAPSPEIIDLKGRRIVWASETPDGAKINEGKVKWLTGGDKLKGRAHHSLMIEFEPTHTAFFLSNFRPRVDPNDLAFWERAQSIPFGVRYLKNPDPAKKNEKLADLYLKEKLRKIAPGILAWMVEGCLFWQRDGLNPPPKVVHDTNQYRDDEDNVSAFVGFLCERAEHYEVGATDLYDAFYMWWIKFVGKTPPKQKKFGSQLKQMFYSETRGGYVYYQGVRLRSNWRDVLGHSPGFGKPKDKDDAETD